VYSPAFDGFMHAVGKLVGDLPFELKPAPVEEKKPLVPPSKAFHACAEISPGAAKARLMELAEEIIAVLAQDPNAEIRVNLEIHADYPNGASDQIKRAVTENAKMLGMKMAEWEG
jgi:hypothetical protein